MCNAPLCSTNLSGHINRFALTCSQEAARALASSADGCIPLLIPGLSVVHCTLSAAFLGPKRLQVSSAGIIGRHSMSISGCRKQKSRYRPRRCPMSQPILCLDEEVYHFAKRFDVLSRTTASATGSPTVAPQSLNRGKERDKPPCKNYPNSSCSFHGTVTIVNHITFTVFNCTYGQGVDFIGTIYSDDHLEGTWNHGIWRAS
jgi:hypothetical protein